MRQIRIGNDIKFSIALTGAAADVIKWHVYVKQSAPELPKGTVVLNGRKEHYHGRVIELSAVQVSTSATSGKTVTAVWTADKQMLGVWDVIVMAETASGSKAAADVQRVLEITKHTGVPEGDASGTVAEIVSLGTLSITFSGMSAYELAVSKGYTGTVTEWLLSLKGAKGDTGATGAAGHSPAISTKKYGGVTTVYVDGVAVAEINDGAKGVKGDTGATGAAGHSPAISTRKYGGVTTVYVDGVAVAEINDGAKGDTGAQGQKGDAGADGADGLTPNITASKTGNVTTVYADGVEIAQIVDGAKGDKGDKGDTGEISQEQLATLATKTELNTKVDKVAGYGLSKNDYSDEEKQKLSQVGAKIDVLYEWELVVDYTVEESVEFININNDNFSNTLFVYMQTPACSGNSITYFQLRQNNSVLHTLFMSIRNVSSESIARINEIGNVIESSSCCYVNGYSSIYNLNHATITTGNLKCNAVKFGGNGVDFPVGTNIKIYKRK